MEKKYEFRKKLLQVHKKNIRNYDATASADDFSFSDEVIITLPQNSGVVIENAVKDFCDFLFTSMNISARCGCSGEIEFEINKENPERVTCFKINVGEKIKISAADERSAAQALYYLEDLMTERKAPFIKKGEISKQLAFSPRMIRECGYSIHTLPDEYLAQIAHNGFNAILIRFTGDNTNTPCPETISVSRFTEVVKRTQKWGIDLYILSEIPNKYHPDAPEAEEYYAKAYGDLIKNYPEIRGMVLVGESIGFPSEDTNTTGGHRTKPADGIPREKSDTGFYPCYDYYKLVNIIKKNVRKYNEDFDIVFWTYNWWCGKPLNWGNALETMLNLLPTDISLLVTFELSEQYEMDDVTKFVCDYSIARSGPSQEFEYEANIAKERGIRLYTMASTCGCTWDFGVIPYMPTPQKWIKRYKALFEAQKKYGLSGLLEGWSMGLYPSIISELTKKCFYNSDEDFDAILNSILESRFGENYNIVYKALSLWSNASDYIHSTYDNQYGPLRVGTAYPLCLSSNIKSPLGTNWADNFHTCSPNMFNTLYSVRIDTDKMHWEKVSNLLKEGIDILETIDNNCEEISSLKNLGQYMYHCTETVLNVHKWHKHRALLKVLTDKTEIKKSIECLYKIAADERKNALDSIECLKKDSRLGFEPTEDYYGGEEAVLWKIKHLDYVVRDEIKRYEIELPL